MDSKTLIVFYQQVEPEMVECVGSDSIIIPDQRYSVTTCVRKVLNKTYPRPDSAIAFGIAWGTILEHKIKTEPILFTKH